MLDSIYQCKVKEGTLIFVSNDCNKAGEFQFALSFDWDESYRFHPKLEDLYNEMGLTWDTIKKEFLLPEQVIGADENVIAYFIGA